MGLEYKIKIEYVDGKTGLPMVEEFLMSGRYGKEDYIRKLLTEDGCDFVDAHVWMWDEVNGEWLTEWEKRYYHPNYHEREFYLLKEGGHENRIKNSWAQEIIMHFPSKIVFMVNNRDVGYEDGLMDDPEVLFYKFKYTSEYGKEYKFTVFCNLHGRGCSAEELLEIREAILIPGAKWYCRHFREAYRGERAECAVDIAFTRKYNNNENNNQ